MIDMDAKRFLEDPDVQGESGLNTYYSRDLVLEMLDAAIDAALAAAPAQRTTADYAMGYGSGFNDACADTRVQELERENAALREALLRGVREVEALKRECGTDPESWQAIRNGVYMDISYRMRAALAGTAPAPSKEYAELPKQPLLHAYEIQENGSLKAAFGYSAGQTLAFADATHALRTGGKK